MYCAKPSINLKLTSIVVQAETRKLRAEWTPEAVMEINNFIDMDMGVNVNEVMVDMLVANLKEKEIIKYNELLNDWLKL